MIARVSGVAGAAYYRGLRMFGATALRRHFQDAGLILCYHNVVADTDGQIGDPSLHLPCTLFEEQMRWLANHYRVLSLKCFVERLTSGAALQGSVAVTFDDGYSGVFEHAVPVLETLRIPATVFVVAGAPGRSTGFWWDHPHIVRSETPTRRHRWLYQLRGDEAAILADSCVSPATVPATYRPAGWATIVRHVGDGIDIGVHSETHRSLPTLTDAELEQEIVTGRSIVFEATGIWPEFFAYPYGQWDSRIRATVRNAGYRAALRVGFGLNGGAADPWSLRRLNVPRRISQAAFEAWTAGFHSGSG